MNEVFQKAIEPKSDQLNADDLISGPRTIRIREIRAKRADQQPIDIFYDGDNGKPWRPCKTMARVIAFVWGNPDETFSNWVGKSMTLYCDPEVVFGGLKVGGIRISHMSHISQPITTATTVSKAKRKPFTVQPLAVSAPPVQTVQTPSEPATQDEIDDLSDLLTGAQTMDELKDAGKKIAATGMSDEQKASMQSLYKAQLARIKNETTS